MSQVTSRQAGPGFVVCGGQQTGAAMTIITIVGNLADDFELRYTPSSRAVAKGRVVVNTRIKDGDQWKDGNPSYYPIVLWQQLAENAVESLKKGDRVIVSGRWEQAKSYVDKNGSTVYPWELTVDSIGPDLRYATARVQKMARSSNGGAPAGGSDRDPWMTTTDDRAPAF